MFPERQTGSGASHLRQASVSGAQHEALRRWQVFIKAGLNLRIMGKEQDLLQAVKSGDLLSTQKLLSKLKTNRNSEYTDAFILKCLSAAAQGFPCSPAQVSVFVSSSLCHSLS